MQNDYFPSEKVEQIRHFLSDASHIVILTHMSPDGDAMGSSLALYHWLKSQGTGVALIVPNRFPSFFQWMPGVGDIIVYDERKAEADALLAAADLMLCTDFNEPKRIGQVADRMLENPCPKVLIDHHLHPADFADVTLSYPSSPSASQLVYLLLSTINYQLSTSLHPQLSTLNLSVATCIYTGMMTDTGNFSFNSNHPEMYEILAELVRAGVDKDAVYNAVFNAYSADRMRLVGYCLYSKMRIFPEHHAALVCLSRKELYRFRFQTGDAEGIVNMPLQISDVRYSCFMREDKLEPHERERAGNAKTKVKISFRSQGDRPVNVFAADWFHGGGHANAAGGEFYGTVAEAAQCFLDHYQDYFRKD
ncbi:MAG: DHH family phosphoesterase [Paludibacteraceae bacterium]|nr:DHH family phosphoesterase [Paludibacteraceae bacterium]